MKNFIDTVSLIPKCIEQMTKFAAILTCIAITVDIFLAIFFRYVLNNSLQWAEEAGVYSMIWMVFLGSVLLVKDSEHISITALVRRLPLRTRMLVDLFTTTIGIIFFLLIAYYGIKVFQSPANAFSHSCHISTKWIKLAIPVGAILMTLESGSLLFDKVATFINKNDNSREE